MQYVPFFLSMEKRKKDFSQMKTTGEDRCGATGQSLEEIDAIMNEAKVTLTKSPSVEF